MLCIKRFKKDNKDNKDVKKEDIIKYTMTDFIVNKTFSFQHTIEYPTNCSYSTDLLVILPYTDKIIGSFGILNDSGSYNQMGNLYGGYYFNTDQSRPNLITSNIEIMSKSIGEPGHTKISGTIFNRSTEYYKSLYQLTSYFQRNMIEVDSFIRSLDFKMSDDLMSGDLKSIYDMLYENNFVVIVGYEAGYGSHSIKLINKGKKSFSSTAESGKNWKIVSAKYIRL